MKHEKLGLPEIKWDTSLCGDKHDVLRRKIAEIDDLREQLRALERERDVIASEI